MVLAYENVVPFGLDGEGRRVHVNDVPRGRACGAFCPACRAPLQARQGDVLSWHFAHEGQGGGRGCGEGLLHREIKERLAAMASCQGAASGQYPGGGPVHNLMGGDYIIGPANVAEGLVSPGVICGQDAKTEFWLSDVNRRVDVMVQFYLGSPSGIYQPMAEPNTLWVDPDRLPGWFEWVALEVAVSHTKDAAYIDDMRRAGLPAYEVRFAADELRRLTYGDLNISDALNGRQAKRLWPTDDEVKGAPRALWPVNPRWRAVTCEGAVLDRCVSARYFDWDVSWQSYHQRRLDQRWCDDCEAHRQETLALLRRHGKEVA